MQVFKLEILTPERFFYKGDCCSLVVPITDGMLGVMANREPITASLTDGEAHFSKPDGERVRFSITSGMIDVQNNKVTILCEYALLPEEIDEEAAHRQAEEAKCNLAKKQSLRDYKLSKLMLSRAVNNLKIKQKTTVN